MIQVNFYILAPDHPNDRWQFACRLTEKAYQQGHRVHIHTDNESAARNLDQLLWTFRDGSFVPHGLMGEVDPELTPVLLSAGQEPLGNLDVLLNLAPAVPAYFNRCQRVAEIIDADPDCRTAGRARFRYYRDQGYVPNTHELTP